MAAPGDGENCPPPLLLDPTVFSLLTCCLQTAFLSVSPFCMHAPQCLCYSSVTWTPPAFSVQWPREETVWTIRQQSPISKKDKTAHNNVPLIREDTVYMRISLHLLIASTAVPTVISQWPCCVSLVFFCLPAFKPSVWECGHGFDFRNAWFWLIRVRRCSCYKSLLIIHTINCIFDWLKSTDVSIGLQFRRTEHHVGEWLRHYAQPLWGGGDWVRPVKVNFALHRSKLQWLTLTVDFKTQFFLWMFSVKLYL